MDDIAQMNLRVLRRHNPLVELLIDKSSYSVIYTFSTASTSWTKAGYEGTLFIYSQQPHDIQTHTGVARGGRYGFCVLNRLNLENFWWEMDGGDVVLEDQIIIMRSLTGEVYGLWLFEESDRTRIFNLLQRLNAQSKVYDTPVSFPTGTPGTHIDLNALFTYSPALPEKEPPAAQLPSVDRLTELFNRAMKT